MKLTHDDLVEKARKKLIQIYPIVITELVSASPEQPDAIGFGYWGTTLIECKISKSDFYSDKNKSFRKTPELGMGDFRYYLTPANLLNPMNLPPKWGLYEVRGSRIFTIKKAEKMQANKHGEQMILISAIRRQDSINIKKYTIPTKCRATITLRKEAT